MSATQGELLPIAHRSLQKARLKKIRDVNPERVYAARWLKENRRHSYVNHGFTALEWILCPTGQGPRRLTQRDAEVAASVIQWLGTPCGLSFLLEAERTIDRLQRSESAKAKRPSLMAAKAALQEEEDALRRRMNRTILVEE